jgi:hypothetical protein
VNTILPRGCSGVGDEGIVIGVRVKVDDGGWVGMAGVSVTKTGCQVAVAGAGVTEAGWLVKKREKPGGWVMEWSSLTNRNTMTIMKHMPIPSAARMLFKTFVCIRDFFAIRDAHGPQLA